MNMDVDTDKKMKVDTKVAIFAAVLAFTGAIGGTIVGDFLQESRWRNQIDYAEGRKLIDKRIELIEKTSFLVNRKGYAETLSKELSFWSSIAEMEKAIALANISTKDESKIESKRTPDELLKKYASSKEKLSTLSSKYTSIMQMNAIFFGDKTRVTLKKIRPISNWWDVDNSLHEELIQVMYTEIKYGL